MALGKVDSQKLRITIIEVKQTKRIPNEYELPTYFLGGYFS